MPLELAKLSLDLIRAFVAVGRRMSITLAARDLCLTQSAVSRQIQALEVQLGIKLFVRSYRSVSFTADGARLFRSADDALRQLQETLGDLRASAMPKPVTVSATFGFTGLWLLPRLKMLQARHPGVDVRVSANNDLVELRKEGVDLAIRYTSATLAPAGSRRLIGESVAPVAHPSLGAGSLRSGLSLPEVTLLEFDDPRYPRLQWRSWLEAIGREGARPRAFLHFNQYDLVIQAALAGQGIALGRLELIAPLLEEGRLVMIDPPQGCVESSYGHWLIHADVRPRREVADVAAWIEAEAAL
ncbi:MAG: LysR substrate-binding domain-containing protein [Pseudomonadota bacterium]